MLPISEAMFAKRFRNTSNSNIDWILFDVYKIAPHYPLEVSIYGYVFNEKINEISNYQTTYFQRLQVTDKFSSKSNRDNLKGLHLKCGLVVCIKNFFFT